MSDQNNDSNERNLIADIAKLITAITPLILLFWQIFGDSSPPPQCTPRELTEEVKFALNSFDHIITGCIAQNNPDTYFLDARINQEFQVEITSGEIELTVFDSNGRFFGEIYSSKPNFRGRLPSNGKIKVVVRTQAEMPMKYGLYLAIK